MSGSFSRRAVVRAIPAVALTAPLAIRGYGRAAAQDTQNTDLAGSLTVWAMGAEGEKLPTLAQDFTAEFANVSVEVTPVAWDQAHQKLLTSIAGGGLPDVSQIGTTWMGELAVTGALAQPPETFTQRSAEFWEGAWSAVTVEEAVHGVPWYVDTRVLYYRTDLLEQAGFSQAPQTWEELKQAATKLKNEVGTRFGINLHPRADFLPFIWQAGGVIYQDGTFHLNTPEVIEALTWYQSFFKEELTSTDPQYDVHQAFINGDAPMFYSGPWSIGLINDQSGGQIDGKWSVALMPQNKTRTSFLGGSALAVFADGDNMDASWAFTDFLTRPDVQARWYELTGDLPAVKAAWETGELSSDPLLQIFGEQLTDAQAPPAIPEWQEVSTAIDDNLETVTLGNATPEAAAQAMQEVADSAG
jgi:multiple sugar transport system substrate-binding protein